MLIDSNQYGILFYSLKKLRKKEFYDTIFIDYFREWGIIWN